MGFLTYIKSMWDPQARIESTIHAQMMAFEQERHRHPERDPNAWLAGALGRRPGWWGRPEEVYYFSTAVFSMVPGKDAPKAIALWILSKEETALAERCTADFEYLTAPVLGLSETGE